MIENQFLMLRALVLHLNETNLRAGLINFLKEMETEQDHAEEAVAEVCDGREDCDCEDAAIAHMFEPYLIADRLFQYLTFGVAKEPLDGHEEPEGGQRLPDFEIDELVERFRDQLNNDKGTTEEENND